MRKPMTEKQVDFCRAVYEQVREVLFLRTPFAEDREVIFRLNQRASSLGWCYVYDSDLARIEISEYALDDNGFPFMETLVHECIHACLPMYEHHGSKFKQACVVCGEHFGLTLSRLASPSVTKEFVANQPNQPKGKYEVVWEDGVSTRYKTKRAWVVKDLLAHGGSRVYKLKTGETMRAKLIVRGDTQ